MVNGMTVGMFLLNSGKGFTPQDHLIRFLPAKGERSRTSIDKLGLAENPNRVPSMEKNAKSLTVPGYGRFFRVLEKLVLPG